ncbi:hypothetical protein FDUTEX481_02069 [Tolypothrix sp. PCC 7601]|nr:hypothetical protein FDUTEX481_02069 [Tolypothrix sp. PCC 7601]
MATVPCEMYTAGVEVKKFQSPFGESVSSNASHILGETTTLAFQSPCGVSVSSN